jgi:hypothetical protein
MKKETVRQVDRKVHPRSLEDFEKLYHALEGKWNSLIH